MKILIDGQTLYTPEINRGIGVYFKNVIENIIEQSFSHEIHMTMADLNALKYFKPWARDRIKPIINEIYHPANACSSPDVYVQTLHKDIEDKNIQIYWNPNPLMQNVVLPFKTSKVKFMATIYDLIPIRMKKYYLDQWSEKIRREYIRKLKILYSDYDMLICISKSTKNDLIKYTNIDENRCCVIYVAPDKRFKPYPFERIPTDENYILYIGGFDPRKNMYRALKAFKMFHKLYEKHIKLYIVCAFNKENKNEFQKKIDELELEGLVQLKGYISDEMLLSLYQKSLGLFFPSLYEGFGLPLLEALACGIPVACSKTSSLPEVCGNMAIYFDPFNITEMAQAINKLLQEPLDYETRLERYSYTKSFEWSKCAAEILQAMRKLLYKCHTTHIFKKGVKKRDRIAWVSPFPPQKSGVSNYSFELVKQLKKHIDVDLYYDSEFGKPNKEVRDMFPTYTLDTLKIKFGEYANVVYNIGNNILHKNIYKMAWNFPATIILHDFNIHPFMQQAFFMTEDEEYYKYSLINGYGNMGSELYEKALRNSELDVFEVPLSHAIVNRSRRVIVHNQWTKEQLHSKENIHVIPLFAKINYYPSSERVEIFKEQYGIRSEHFVVSSIGFINRNKLPDLQIKVIIELIKKGYPIKMIFGGELSPDVQSVHEKIVNSGFKDSFIFTGYQSEEDYFTTIFASDVLINLRKPTMGEASGTLLHILAAGKPVIVSELHQYKEFPNSVCWKVPHDQGADDEYLLEYLKELLSNKELRACMGSNARRYAQQLFDIDRCVEMFLDSLFQETKQ